MNQKFGGFDDEMHDDDDEDEEKDEQRKAAWGGRKTWYYDADNADYEVYICFSYLCFLIFI